MCASSASWGGPLLCMLESCVPSSTPKLTPAMMSCARTVAWACLGPASSALHADACGLDPWKAEDAGQHRQGVQQTGCRDLQVQTRQRLGGEGPCAGQWGCGVHCRGWLRAKPCCIQGPAVQLQGWQTWPGPGVLKGQPRAATPAQMQRMPPQESRQHGRAE